MSAHPPRTPYDGIVADPAQQRFRFSIPELRAILRELCEGVPRANPSHPQLAADVERACFIVMKSPTFRELAVRYATELSARERGGSDRSAADVAVLHLFERVLSDPRLAYYIGPASRSLELLMAARAELAGLAFDAFVAKYDPMIRTERPRCCECPHCNPEQREANAGESQL